MIGTRPRAHLLMPTIRIALDVTPCITGATGIARHVSSLRQALSGLPDVSVAAFAVGRGAHPTPDGTRHLRLPLRVVARSWGVGGPPRVERLAGEVDSVHASGSVLPATRRPLVAVVHDLAPLDHPELHPRRDVAQLRRYLSGLGRAAAVVTVSHATAERLRAEGVEAERIHVIPNGVTPLPPPGPSPLPGRPYVLAVGAPVPRKAYATALRAVAQLGSQDLHVVVLGPTGSEDRALGELAGRLGLSERYHRPGRVDDQALASWYAGATALIAPSVDEGFGLPPLEAQALGVPVVASDIPAHREIAGGGATLVPVGDAEALAGALQRILAGDQEMREIAARGPENAFRYTWSAAAAATAALHRQLVG